MKTATTLLSASLVLLLSPAAAGTTSSDGPTDLAARLEFPVDPDEVMATLGWQPVAVCTWFEPGIHVDAVIVDLNHYLIQIPVPATDSDGSSPSAGTYFIQASFSGAGCSG